MKGRKELILNTIIEEHIKTGAPVGSGVLAQKYKLNVSPATVRNEMVALEDEGFIIQPHTSAGRIPTEGAYKLYLRNLNEKRLNDAEVKLLERALKKNDELSLKKAAKIMAQISGNAVFWAFHRHSLYYTGISSLLQQPEFYQFDLIYNISAIIDRMDEVIDNIFDKISFESQVLLGSENPFGDFCGSVLTKYRSSDKVGLFGILGPIRMDYAKNLALAKFVNSKISK
jgi:heat-inducible transcriptional repressor